MNWEKYSQQKIQEQVFEAIGKNINYRQDIPIGFPGSYLDPKIFYDAPFLKNAPFLSSMAANPNHIGCHTRGTDSEPVFEGTQEIEREVIAICAEQIFRASTDSVDGYVASGGTEGNIEAFWVMRNFFIEKYSACPAEIGLVYSSDAHYSMAKGANILNIDSIVVAVDDKTRQMDMETLTQSLTQAQARGVKYFVVVMNLATTMFGSVDDMHAVMDCCNTLNIHYKIHLDGAFGGFIYPFVTDDSLYSFQNDKVISITLDGHKMLQSPYGTGIFLVRKNYIQYAMTKEANYVKGKDCTLIGSRSGANAIAIWMILRAYGSDGWKAKIIDLIGRTDYLCLALDQRGVEYFRHSAMNIVTIRCVHINATLAKKYVLVPDDHNAPKWWKIVVMDHVTQDILDQFLIDLDQTNALNNE